MSSDLSQNSGDRSSNSDKISHESDMTAHEAVGSDMAGLLTNQFSSNAQNSKGKEKDGSGFLRSSPRILQKMQKLGSVKQKSDIVTISGKANNKNALTTNGSGSKNDKVMSMNESALSANTSDKRNLLDNEKEIENKAGQDKKDEENTDVESSGTNTELSASKTTKKETKADSTVSKDNSTSSAGARKFSVANKAIKVIPTLIKRHSEKKELLAKKSPYSEQQTVNVKNATNLTVSGNKSAATNGKDKNGKQKDLKTRSASAKQSQGDENMSNKTDSAPRSKHSELVNEGGDKTGGMPHVGKTKWTALITPATTESARGKSTEEGIGNPLSPKVIVSDKDEKEHNTALTVPKENHGEDEANRGSRLSVQSSHSRRESFSRMSIDSRFVDFSKTQNATVVHPPGMEEDTKKGIVANNDSYIQSAIPYLPMGVAIVCLILNVILPGTGTMVAGCAVLCSGRPRIESKDDTVMTSCCVNLMVGLCQLFTVTFMMVGWFWSLAWGIHMVILAAGNSTLTQEELIAVIVTPSVGGTLIIAVTVGLCIWWFKCRTRPEEEKNTSNHIVLHDRGPPTAPFDDEPICDSFRHTRAPTRKPIYDSSIDPQGYYENSHFHNPASQPSNGFVKPPQYPQNDENIRYNPLFEHYPTRTREANPNLWNYQEPSDVDGRAAVTSVSRELQDNPSPSRLPRYDPSMPSQPQELRSNPYQQATQSYPSQQATQSYPSQQATQSYPYQQATQSYPYQQATKRSEDPSRKEVASYAKPVYYYDDTLRVDDVQWNPMRMNWTEKKEFQGKLSIPRASKKITY